jgi:hypothetical protein
LAALVLVADQAQVVSSVAVVVAVVVPVGQIAVAVVTVVIVAATVVVVVACSRVQLVVKAELVVSLVGAVWLCRLAVSSVQDLAQIHIQPEARLVDSCLLLSPAM